MTAAEIRDTLESKIENDVVILQEYESGRTVISVEDMAALMADVPLTKSGLESFGGGWEVVAQDWYDASILN